MLRSQALETTQHAPKPPRPYPEPSREPCWTWPGSAPKPPRPSPEPSTEPVEPDLALHLEPSPEPSPEPCWTWLSFAPGTFSGTFSRTFSGNLLRNLLRNPVEPDLALHQSLEPSEPSPEPCWTWPGACTSAHRSYSGLKTPLAYAVGEKQGLCTSEKPPCEFWGPHIQVDSCELVNWSYLVRFRTARPQATYQADSTWPQGPSVLFQLCLKFANLWGDLEKAETQWAGEEWGSSDN